MMPPKVFCVIFVSYFVITPVFSNLWASVEESLSLSRNAKRPCMPPCKVFHSWCKNNGKCREKLPDCAWYCECPANCEGVFCERIVTKTNNEEKVDVQVELIKEKETEKSAFDTLQLHAALANIYKKKSEKSVETPELKVKVESTTKNDTKTICLSEMLKKTDRQKNVTSTETTTEATDINTLANISTNATESARAKTSTDKTLLTHPSVATEKPIVTHTTTETDTNLLTTSNRLNDQKGTTSLDDAIRLSVTEALVITTTPSVQTTTTMIPSSSSATETTYIVPIVQSTEQIQTITTEQNSRPTYKDDTTIEHSTIFVKSDTDETTSVTESSKVLDSSSAIQTTSVLQSSTENYDVTTPNETPFESATINTTTTTVTEKNVIGSEDEMTPSLLYTTSVPGTYVTQHEPENTTQTFLREDMGSKDNTNTSVINDTRTIIFNDNTTEMKITVTTSTEGLQTIINQQDFIASTDATKFLTTIQTDSTMMVEPSNIVTPDSFTGKISETTQGYERTTNDNKIYRSSTPSSDFSTSLTTPELKIAESVTIPSDNLSNIRKQNNREQSNDSDHSSSTSGKFVDSLKNIIDSLIVHTENEMSRKTLAATKHKDKDSVFDNIITDTNSVNKSFETAAELKFTTAAIREADRATTKVYTKITTSQSQSTAKASIENVEPQTKPESSIISPQTESSTMNSSFVSPVHTLSAKTSNNTTVNVITTERIMTENATVLLSTGRSDGTSESTSSMDIITSNMLREENHTSDDLERTESVQSENIVTNNSAKMEDDKQNVTNVLSPNTTMAVKEKLIGDKVMGSELRKNDSSDDNVTNTFTSTATHTQNSYENVTNTVTSTTTHTETTSQTLPESTSALPQSTLEISSPTFVAKPTSIESINNTSNQTEQNRHSTKQISSMNIGDDEVKHDAVLYPDLAPLLDVLRKLRKSSDSPEETSPKTGSHEKMKGKIKEFSTVVGVSKSSIPNASKTEIQKKEGVMAESVSDIGAENYDVKTSEKQASFKDLGVIQESLKEGLADIVKSVNLIDGESIIVNPSEESKIEAGRDTLVVSSSKDQHNLS